VFVANHQSAFDIFLIYGFLRHPIIWMQKKSLRTIPFVGFASEKAGHVFVDNSSVAARAATIEKAKESINGGISMVIFPEGARTRTGKMGRFKRGAFHIAHDMQLPIVPLTLNGPYEVLKRNTLRLRPGKRMELIIHPPMQTDNLSSDELPGLMEKTREVIHGSLWEKYR
jgi:1-acyl-sn-glycerol-3-phosphate acyltransferase